MALPVTVEDVTQVPRRAADLVNLYHLARVAVGDKRHDRMIWAARQYALETGIAEGRAYKALDRLLAGGSEPAQPVDTISGTGERATPVGNPAGRSQAEGVIA